MAIGAVQSLSPFFDLPAALNAFHERYPQVEITVRETYVDSIAQSLREGSIDLAFLPISGLSLTGLTVDIIFTDEMVALLPPGHHLRERDAIELRDLKDEKFIDFTQRWGTRRLVDQILQLEGVTRQPTFEVENFDLLLQFVSHGFGVALAPRKMTANRDLCILPINSTSGSLPQWRLALVRRKQHGFLAANPPAEMFRILVEHEYQKQWMSPTAS